MKKIIEWFKTDKKRVYSAVVYALLALYAVYCVWFSCEKAFASTSVTLPSEYPSNYQNYVVAYNNGAYIYMITFDEFYDGYDNLVVSDDPYFGVRGVGPCECYYLINDEWVFQYSSNSVSLKLDSDGYILYSNLDIYDLEGALFFQSSPMTSPTIRMGLTKGMIMQIALRVIGGLMVVLLLSVIGFQALRKAWNFLVQNLRKA